MPASTRRRLRLVGAYVVILGAALGSGAVYSLHSAFPYNPVALPGQGVLRLELWFPQGWGFFTRDPREPDLRLLRWQVASGWAFTSPTERRSWLGFERTTRAEGVEVNDLLGQLSDPRQWTDCDQDPVTCVERSESTVQVVNHAAFPAYCGPIAFVFQEPLPWAWRSSRVTMPSRFLRVEVRC